MPEEKKPFDPVAYKTKFNNENYDRLYIHVKKGEKDRLKAHAEKHGESLNEFIKRAISEQICRDTEQGRSPMFETCRPFIDIYGRKFIAVEMVEKTGADGQKYFLYNLYPPTKKRPKRSETNDLGLYYEPYLYMTEEDLRHIFKEYTA